MIKKLAMATAATFVLSSGASAQSQEWEFSGSFYLFAPDTDIDIGDVSTTLSFSDALDKLDLAIMGAFQGNNGTWGFLVDYMRIDLSDSTGAGPLNGDVSIDAKTEAFSGYATYRLYSTETIQTDLLGGFRYFRVKNKIDVDPVIGPDFSVKSDEDWTDPVIGFRTIMRFNDDWSGTLLADYGGTNDRKTYQVFASVNYDFNENWVGSIGLRYFKVKNDDFSGTDETFKFKQFGPMVGVTYRF